MIFNELLYPLFLTVCVLIFHLLPKNLKLWWIFICGTIFYGYYAQTFLYLLLIEIFIIYFLTLKLRENIFAFLFAVIIAVGTLGFFKYKNMFLATTYTFAEFLNLNHNSSLSLNKLILPLAISFFTFEFVHFMVDVRNKKIINYNLKEFLAFIMFFPTMVAGPIKRFQNFTPQVENAKFCFEDLNVGLNRILLGFAKKIIIADSMDLWVQPILSPQAVYNSTLDLWISLFAYSIKIYADFSGYSDIAIGSARLFGIKVPENFLLPYLKPNITLFWRNWHISLTKWIMDYIYIPLGGNRKAEKRTYINIVLAMSISGLWHGADWHFVLWGIYNGVLLVVHRIYSEKVKTKIKFIEKYKNIIMPFSVLITFIFVTLGWGLFIMPASHFFKLLPKLFFIR